MFKRLKHAIMINFLPPLVFIFLILLMATVRIKYVNREAADRLERRGETMILCFWHGRLLAMPFAYRGSKVKVLISRHRDGEFIARVIRYFGFGAVRGSHKKASVSSLREILVELREGTMIAITPDGPKGPRYQVKQGIVELARIAERPIVPVVYSASRKKVFASWDRFVFPFPFSKVLFLWGDPIYVGKDDESNLLDAKRLEVEKTLLTLTETADRMACGG